MVILITGVKGIVKIKYRPEIDGLRAIAVLAVLIYHAQFNFSDQLFFNGGFIGVDIFFVISGYLITSLILKEINTSNKFSFAYFYERRARRLSGALPSEKEVTKTHDIKKNITLDDLTNPNQK